MHRAFLFIILATALAGCDLLLKRLRLPAPRAGAKRFGKRHIPETIVIPVTVKLFPDRNKTSDWTGTINMLDYMAQQPVTLNIRIRALPLSDPKERCLFIELSPVAPGTGIWQQMDTLVKTP